MKSLEHDNEEHNTSETLGNGRILTVDPVQAELCLQEFTLPDNYMNTYFQYVDSDKEAVEEGNSLPCDYSGRLGKNCGDYVDW